MATFGSIPGPGPSGSSGAGSSGCGIASINSMMYTAS